MKIKIKNLFGFFFCEIVTSNGYFGLLPYKSDSGMLLPTGE